MSRTVVWLPVAVLALGALALLLIARSDRDPGAGPSAAGADALRSAETTESGPALTGEPGASPAPDRGALTRVSGERPAKAAEAPLSPLDPERAARATRLRERDWLRIRNRPTRAEPIQIHKAWAEHVAPLIYPPGHPRAGEFRDGVTLDQAVDAGMAFADVTYPEGYLDTPLIRVTRRISPMRVMERSRTWDRQDVESSRAFMQWLLDQPDEIHGPEATFEIRTYPSDPEAYTRGEKLADEMREGLRPQFEER